jgi:hypothetical protein
MELFHYTTQCGLLGILESDSIWATKIQYLNDSSEFAFTLSLARDVLRERSYESGDIGKRARCLLESIDSIELLNICVCSFSQDHDLLSQWRAYGGGTTGYAIGFSSDALVAAADRAGFDLVQCEYDPVVQSHTVTALVDEALAVDFNTTPGYWDSDRPTTFVVLSTGGDFTLRLAQLAPKLKHSKFREEKEWRLISRKAHDVKFLDFRSGQSFLAPYFRLRFGVSKKEYLSRIVVGPGPHMSLATSAMHGLLSKHGAAQEVKVAASEVPFRNW